MSGPPEQFDSSSAAHRAGAAQFLPQVYEELRALAASRLRNEAAGHTLQPTALVHEVYLKLADQSQAQWRDRKHFFAVAAEAIRRILVDHARRRNAAKRAAPGERVTIHADLDAAGGSDVDLVVLDEALDRLAQLSPRQARVVEMRFFGGMEVAEAAEVLGVSENTVKGDWRMARAWLAGQLSRGGGAGS